MSADLPLGHGPDDELARRLAAYADARLAADPGRAPATRTRLIRDAQFAFVAAREGADASSRASSRRGAWWAPRPVRATLMAAALTLTVAIGGIAFASDAGDALYGVRVWWESASLPAGGDERAEAEIERLDARVMELASAVEAGDLAGADAAAVAYLTIVNEAVLGATGDADRELALETALAHHVGVLTALLEKVPGSARDAISHAIGQSSKAIERMGGKPSKPTEPGGTDRPGSTPKPANTNKPSDPGKPPQSPGG